MVLSNADSKLLNAINSLFVMRKILSYLLFALIIV